MDRTKQVDAVPVDIAMSRKRFPTAGALCTLRRKGTTKGVRLIDLESLLDHINSHTEPAFPGRKPAIAREKVDWRRTVEKSDAVFVHQIELNKSVRLIISIRTEKDE